MKRKQTALVIPLLLFFSFFGATLQISSVHAESLSYQLACQDGSWALTTTEKHSPTRVVIRCASGAKFTYMDNSSTAKSQVAGKCGAGEHVGSNVEAPNEESSWMTLYCYTGSAEHDATTRTSTMPTVNTKKITPEDSTPSPSPDTDACKVKTAIIPVDCSKGDNPIWGLLLLVVNILTAGIGIVAIGGIIYAAILWTTAADKNAQIVKSKETIFNVVLGLVAFALFWAFLQFLIPGGVLSVSNTPPPPVATTSTGGGGSGHDGDGGSPSGGGGTGGAVTVDDINLKNLRDASKTSGGKVLKAGVLYRSASLSGLTEKGADKLSQLLGSNAVIIDLRTASQRSDAPDQTVKGVKKVNVPIEGVLDTKPMVTDPVRRSQLANALKTAANADGPVLIHCASGKDRTGWMVAMIMFTAGANEDQVMKEYLKSNEAIPGGVKAEWLKSGLQEARSKYGSIEGYLKAIGLTDGDLAKLKKKFGA